MANEKIKKLPNGKWEYLVNEEGDMIVVADTLEEAERMAKAYFAGNKSVAKKRVARGTGDKARTTLVGKDE
jgi:hypothetical protein